MTIGERIKKIRKELDLTQAEFGSRIGSVQNTVTGYESGRRNPSAPVIALICKEFSVCEEWLRNGKGEMFKPAPSDELDNLARKYNLSNAAYVVVEKFVNLNPDKQNELIDFLLDVSKAIIESEADPNGQAVPDNYVGGFSEDSLIQAFKNVPKSAEELEAKFPPVADENSDVG